MVDELARERAAAAHKRLDGINGQIAGVNEKLSPMQTDVASLKTMARIGGAVAMALLVATLSLLVAVLTRHTPAPGAAPQGTPRVENTTGRYPAVPLLAARERGAHGRLAAP